MARQKDAPTLLSVIVPVYNEAKTIRQILAQVRAVDLGPHVNREIIHHGSEIFTLTDLYRVRGGAHV